MLRLASLLFVLATVLPTATAQATPIGSCPSSGMQIACAQPQIGTNWWIGERSGTACGYNSGGAPIPMVTIFGGCIPGIPIATPPACSHCSGCSLYVYPGFADMVWNWPPRTTVLPIPNDPNLIGAMFCMQNACIDQLTLSCVCVSGGMQVQIMP